MNYSIAAREFISFDAAHPCPVFMVNDKDSPRVRQVKRHIRHDEYFGTAAAIVNLTCYISKEIERCAKQISQVNKKNIKRLEKLRDDLIYLQKECRVIKREQSKK